MPVKVAEGEEMRAGRDIDIDRAYRTYRLALVRLAIMLVDDLATAEDLVQDAFVGLQKNRSKVEDPDGLLGYLRAAVINRSRSLLRRRRTLRRMTPMFGPETTDSADAEMMLAEEHREVFDAMRKLPSRQREVIVLRYWSGMSESEIAEALCIST